ncbi:MAG: carboxypeptidase regulatory-like domain-containing protein [Candidatus Acidiferrales bacterium]
MKISRLVLGCAILSCLSLLLPVARAQYRAGIQGSVLDPQGGVVGGATVSLTSVDTNHTVQTTTSSGGVYTFPSLAPGRYTIVVEKQGFKKKVLDDVIVAGEQVQAVNVTLEVGAATQSVTINASEAPLIDTETGQISGTLTNAEIQNLPSIGRDPFQLLRLAPGVFGDGAQAPGGAATVPGSAGINASTAGTQFGSPSSVFATENGPQVFAGGQRNEGNNFQVDGVAVNSQVWGGATLITPNEESVKEVRITSSSYDAEYGRSTAAQVEVVSKSGTNSYHGSLFIKMDRPGLNSFQGYNGPSGPSADQRVTNRFNQFGGSVGGPIIKNRVFAFFSYETQRNRTVSLSTGYVETPQYGAAVKALTGNLSASILNFPGEDPSISKVLPTSCAQANFPAANCNAVGVGLDIGSPLKLARGTKDPSFGAATTPFGIGGGLDGIPDIQFVEFANPNNAVGTQWNGRLDFQVTNKDLVTFSTYWVPDTDTFLNGEARAANLWHSDRTNYSEALLWNHTFSSTLINEARVNVSRWHYNELKGNSQEPFGLLNDSITGYPGVANGTSWGPPNPGELASTGYNIRDTVSKALNKHFLKFGVDIYKNQLNQLTGGRPTYNFNNFWDFANDAPVQENGAFNPTNGVPDTFLTYGRDNNYALFVQDDYKLKPNLTVNLGLRWEYFGPFHEKNGNMAVAVLGPPPNQLADLKLRLGGNLYNTTKHDFGPQLGFAWSPDRFQSRLVIRGGFGIGYERTEDAIGFDALGNTSPLLAQFSLSDPNILYAAPSNPHQFSPYPANPNAKLTFDPVTNLPVSGETPVNVFAWPANILQPYTYRYSLEGQYDLGHSWVATVGYQGTSSHRLIRWNFLGNTLFTPRNPEVGPFFPLRADDVDGNYNALLTQLQKRFSHGFELDAQYTYSSAHDEASNVFQDDSTYTFNSKALYGPSDYDATHNFKVYGVWTPRIFSGEGWKEKVAGGWTFSGIFNAHSGFPWTPFYNVSVTGTPSGNTCSLIFDNSNYCNVRPAAYLGGAKSNFSNNAFEQQLGNFPNGPATYFTPPALTVNGRPPVPGVGRNSFRGPRYASTDFTIGKAFGLPNMKVIGEGAKLDFRINFYNLFNQINLQPFGNQPIGTILLNSATGVQTNPTAANGNVSGTFGQAQSGFAGRVIEAQARFSF